ncbi:hypothetical protein FKV24_004480 [Lysobacter maris]|uniref:Uncharacterized protein n=1 Tax=Marilutibacter maris TaxID=1605891 RepID=A0A508B5A9_9GAMM|nr:hypothetical protein [Lysobacter maris]KAB8196207.1 hypothetical protein FKV24_004480 [Lysobacter maris]
MLKTLTSWWKNRQQARREALMFERQVVVSFDDTSVSATFPSGEVQSIAWTDVDCVAIETNDSGPWDADVWWLLEGAATRVAYPQGATGDSEMLDQFSDRFPRFNDAAVIEAVGCTSNARFVCWQRGGEA